MSKKRGPKHAAPKAPQQTRNTKKKYDRRQLDRRRRQRHTLIVLLAVLVVLAAVMLAVTLLQRDGLKGTWALDDTTVYEFDGRGHGTLRLPLGSYEFSYTVEEDRLTIDFADDTATDAGYTFRKDGATLTLDTNTGTVYRLDKQK